ncbi:conserved hypothetical protein [Methylocella tundrae]|uniref:DUF6460 domain-containing protein n=1 Tax=Methylocella tundrae TaxID=227605 RepID=A0A8B6M6N3_METTU|nr:DUF6460 domain-containing protein [Methylocella tundrae]VTZ26165.1 conserved hypothetical protein [Methylocella tundrae]VTZ49742.1 conserved hypothetical protein [Methylocella tundrae]
MTDRMSDPTRSTPEPPPGWTRSTPEPPPGWTAGQRSPAAPRSGSALNRFLGGSPASVFLRLFFVSLIVGALFMWLDIRPIDIFRGLTDLFNRIYRMGFDAIREVFDYVLVGAAIVVPIWLVLRLLNMRGER